MSENKKQFELKDEELENVTGGSVIMCGWEFYGHVGQYNGIVGQKYYLVCDYEDAYVYGELKWTGEKHEFLWTTSRYHKIKVEKSGGNNFDWGEHEYEGCNWSLYKYRRKAK